MNTGTQRSGMTLPGARTTTTWSGKCENPKDLPRIMEAHNVPYVASTSAVYPADVYDKVLKAKGIHGLRYIHMNVPCPSGWAFDPKDTVRLGQLAVETGLVVLYEIVSGELRLTGKSKSLVKSGLKPVSEYLGTQGRFRGIAAETVEQIQTWVDMRWAEYVQRDAGICETF